MKTIKSDQPSLRYGSAGKWQVASLRQASARQAGDRMKRTAHSRHAQRGLQPSAFPPSVAKLLRRTGSLQPSRHAFTLIELLVVMAVIGVLASLLLAVVSGVKKKQYVYNTRAEMEQIETAIERYKAAYGVYPPSAPTLRGRR